MDERMPLSSRCLMSVSPPLARPQQRPAWMPRAYPAKMVFGAVNGNFLAPALASHPWHSCLHQSPVAESAACRPPSHLYSQSAKHKPALWYTILSKGSSLDHQAVWAFAANKSADCFQAYLDDWHLVPITSGTSGSARLRSHVVKWLLPCTPLAIQLLLYIPWI